MKELIISTTFNGTDHTLQLYADNENGYRIRLCRGGSEKHDVHAFEDLLTRHYDQYGEALIDYANAIRLFTLGGVGDAADWEGAKEIVRSLAHQKPIG